MSIPKILVIKLGALGDFIQACGAMKAIREHHKDAHITLLTTKPFAEFANDCGYFNNVWIDEKPRWHQISKWLLLRTKLNAANFTRVYDLQNNDRTSLYFKLFSSKPEWSGVAKGSSHQNSSPERIAGHAFDGHKQTLSIAGIQNVHIDTLDWMKSDISKLNIETPYILLVPGSAPNRPEKRWPAEKYAELAKSLINKKYNVLILGTKAEETVARKIEEQCSGVINLTGKTNLFDIVELARQSTASIGNDTGPMHLIAATGCKCITIFSKHSNYKRHYPKGDNSEIIFKENINEISAKEIMCELGRVL